ncbi:metal-dependent hydrolase [Heyndrickxia oleronia]|uniref:Metal-dependent hydrolase n=1 Tax=Heyndrickxia oleronia TaxID=38875 RepID=A0A8E2I4G9_9BACI|nr:metal-dependent hydrolase [Heyndrickxia oleronia]OJH17190.1 hypothetical protein BLX88_19375 [Bacillus obstructivus]MCM3454597.1 metal-dependent hydrolase [Heyndrickxia oleronia]MEC1377310.1 metal-dependent hydrolase [Heyndrickxia oleronia]OOP66554.1 hypothetical protein BWZ43_20380 [Heyndrickxia oleronia]QQZ03903.1 metal-dependent hydrolase [Heyndrickxia oleronia]
MRYKTHIVSSLTLGAGISITLHYPFHVGYVLGIMFGSLLPDIDEPRSFIGRRSFGFASFVNETFGHRGITHSLFAWGIVSFFCLLSPTPFTIGISLGYLFHLFGDFFSVRSIQLFLPFHPFRPKLPLSYKTGSLSEDILFYIFTILLVYFVFILGHLHHYFILSSTELLDKMIHILVEIIKGVMT